jgi:hypothetical protein
MKNVLIIGIAAALAAFAVACGGGGGDKTATPAPKATSAPPTATAKAAATTAATAPAESAAETTELAKDVATLREIMQSVITKAQAGDLQGTKDTEGAMDDPIEAIVKALKPVDAALADSIEQRELAIEHEADATTTDLAVIAKNAQEILPLLDQVVAKLKLPTTAADSGAASSAELAADIKKLKTIMQDVITKANAGDLQGTKDTEGTMDDPIEAIVKALKPVDAALADSIEQHELAIEHEADASITDLTVIAKNAQEILPLLDQAATKLKISP